MPRRCRIRIPRIAEMNLCIPWTDCARIYLSHRFQAFFRRITASFYWRNMSHLIVTIQQRSYAVTVQPHSNAVGAQQQSHLLSQFNKGRLGPLQADTTLRFRIDTRNLAWHSRKRITPRVCLAVHDKIISRDSRFLDTPSRDTIGQRKKNSSCCLLLWRSLMGAATRPAPKKEKNR